LTRRDNIKKTVINVFCCFLMCVAVIGSWAMYARATDSPTSPTYGHVNLAMRYFPTESDPFTVEARQELASRFQNYMDVMSYDPYHVILEYAKDAGRTAKRILFGSELLPFLWIWVSLAGVVLLFLEWHTPFALMFLLATVAQIGLVNFKSYEPRFFLFLIPLLGAGLGVSVKMLFQFVKMPRHQIVVWGLLLVLIVPNLRWTYYTAYRRLHKQDQELSEAVGSIRNITDKTGDFIITGRKPHIPYYNGINVFVDQGYTKLPDIKDGKELKRWLTSMNEGKNVFLYFGSYERSTRPGLAFLSDPHQAPAWLESLVYGGAGGGWVFYRFIKEHSG